MKTLWVKWKAVAPWIMLAALILMFITPIGWLPEWVTLVTLLFTAPAIFTVFWENRQAHLRRVYNAGYRKGQEDANKE